MRLFRKLLCSWRGHLWAADGSRVIPHDNPVHPEVPHLEREQRFLCVKCGERMWLRSKFETHKETCPQEGFGA